MKNYISIADVLQFLRLGRKATIIVCSLDLNRNTGGERVTYQDIVLRDTKIAGQARPSGTPAAGPSGSKNPHHRFNKTINIQTKNGDIITIHPVLIEEYNGLKVTL